MEEFVEYIAKALVERPDEVRVTRIEGARVVILEVRVAAADVGRVIGKDGRTVNAIRTLVQIVAARADRRVTVVII